MVGGRGGGRSEAPEEEAPAALALSLLPDEPKASDELQARLPLPADLTQPVNVAFTWTVNGERLVGQGLDRLPSDQGFFRRGDRVKVSAVVTDGDGNVTELSSEAVGIANATPVILTNVRNTSDLDGKELEASDPDGDEITWKIVSGPPGVSITRGGRLQVRVGAMETAWDGELVVGAEDPVGARAELHIPVSVNAAVAAKREEKKVVTATSARQFNDEELARRSEDEVERTMKMSDKELQEYEKKREGDRTRRE
jgi:hypothetical protein